MIALTLLTSVIAVGGIQNAYAGFPGQLDCHLEPLIVDIILPAGGEFEEFKFINCDLEADFIIDEQLFEVGNFDPECDNEIEVSFSDPIIDQDSLIAEFDETIKVLEIAASGPYRCDIEFLATVIGNVSFCQTADGNFIGPLNQDGIDRCIGEGGDVETEPFQAINSSILEQEILVLVPDPDPTIHVHIDIKPESCPNPINPNSRGLLPVAILGNEVDVEDIDVSTVTLAGVSPMKHNIEDVATPHAPVTGVVNPLDCSTEGPDGIDDLTLKFDTQEIVAALGLDGLARGTAVQVQLTGNLLDGTPIESYDVIIVR